MADIVGKARVRLQALSAQRAEIDAEVAELEQFLKTAAKMEAKLGADEALATEKAEIVKVANTLIATSKRIAIVHASREILARGSMHTRALLSEVKARGIHPGGTTETEQVANLSGYLSREKHLFNSDRIYGWSLKQTSPEGVGTPTGPT